MAKLSISKNKKLGKSPGTLIYIGKEKLDEPKVTLIQYNDQTCTEREITSIQEYVPPTDSTEVFWYNIDGVHNPEVIASIGNLFSLHPLLLEDIMNTGQKPKVEYYEKTIFVVLKMITFNNLTQRIHTEHVSLVLGENYVLSFQEKAGDVFDPVRSRLFASVGKTRRSGADYLLYCLIDMIVDNYYVVLEGTGDHIELLEEKIITRSSKTLLEQLYKMKRELIELRKSTWPVREIVSKLMLDEDETELVTDATVPYLRDVHDHATQVIDTIEIYREQLASLLDVYLSMVSYRMNNVMKILTIFSTIFMPLTFVVGIYGMNFENMPELRWENGYFYVLGLMGVMVIIMLIFFRRMKWI
jgi:magnesium transporter